MKPGQAEVDMLMKIRRWVNDGGGAGWVWLVRVGLGAAENGLERKSTGMSRLSALSNTFYPFPSATLTAFREPNALLFWGNKTSKLCDASYFSLPLVLQLSRSRNI